MITGLPSGPMPWDIRFTLRQSWSAQCTSPLPHSRVLQDQCQPSGKARLSFQSSLEEVCGPASPVTINGIAETLPVAIEVQTLICSCCAVAAGVKCMFDPCLHLLNSLSARV